MNLCIGSGKRGGYVSTPEDGMVISGTKGKALFLYSNSLKRQFPDFHTFTMMGYNTSNIRKMKDELIDKNLLGTPNTRIKANAVFRPDDYM